ncbi:hypothetical protein NPA31_002315 [Aurantimonas sp. MSK8Z-1]|uniref:hypothetical protein n=1 Tax=Mangrovibrevibacter kandeliae TaxID=2968473 RepID=UPI002117A6F4|nr:hypothetical protein [Aurantimonas sp. MSK8Z-1]MCW4113797.1 hypothetical protein [Aurantimonas sp. MSK8Z-1]
MRKLWAGLVVTAHCVALPAAAQQSGAPAAVPPAAAPAEPSDSSAALEALEACLRRFGSASGSAFAINFCNGNNRIEDFNDMAVMPFELPETLGPMTAPSSLFEKRV